MDRERPNARAASRTLQPCELLQTLRSDANARPTQTLLPLCPRTRQTGSDALLNPRALELRDGTQDVELQTAGGRGRVDALVQADELDAERGQLVEEQNEVAQIPTEPVEPPDHDDVEPPPPRVLDK